MQNLDEFLRTPTKEGKTFATEKMNEYRDKALCILDEFEESPVKTALGDLIKYTVTRKK